MAGHSKWANIKHRKGRQDAKRGKLFAKLIKAIEVAARNGGGDLSANPTLVAAVQKAKDVSVPKDNIERAIARGSGDLEGVVYEEGSGQLLNASFMDYAMPRAGDVPAIEVTYNPVPCTTNPLGVKGAGEAGAVGSAPAVINAVLDALGPLGIDHIDMPATPEKIWRAIQDAHNSTGPTDGAAK